MYIQPNNGNWSGRVDSEHDETFFRLHQMITLKKVDELGENEDAFGIVGFESDEGVRRNKGRMGADKGPDAIRNMLAKLPNNIDVTRNIEIITICLVNDDYVVTHA